MWISPNDNAPVHCGHVAAVCSSPHHGFSKQPQPSIQLLAGQGVQGDAHCGATVQHLYLKRRNANAPNRMQVHLLQSELFDELAAAGFSLDPGDLGENITTCNIDLLTLSLGTRLHVGTDAVIELTGLRTPCSKIDGFRQGLLKQVKTPKQHRIPARAGVMGIVLQSGPVTCGDSIYPVQPPGPWKSLPLV